MAARRARRSPELPCGSASGDTAHVAIAVAATGFAAFSLAMTAGRLAGDRVVGRLGAVRALRGSGGLAATGLGAALLIGGPIAGILGFGLVGAGIANIIPVLFSSTGHSGGGAASSALAAVAVGARKLPRLV